RVTTTRRLARGFKTVVPSGATCAPKPPPLPPSPRDGEGEIVQELLRTLRAPPVLSGPPSPLCGEGPRVRFRSAGRSKRGEPHGVPPFRILASTSSAPSARIAATQAPAASRGVAATASPRAAWRPSGV